MRVNVEYTDTFCGEANYSWVKRASFDADEDASDLAIVRKAKAEIGLSGIPCNRDDFGDMIRLTPRGSKPFWYLFKRDEHNPRTAMTLDDILLAWDCGHMPTFCNDPEEETSPID